MKRLLAVLLLAGVALFSSAPAEAANNHGHHGHHHGSYGRSYGYYRPGVYSSYGYPYGYGYGYYGPGYVNSGYPGAVFVSPQSFGYGPAAVQSMFGF